MSRMRVGLSLRADHDAFVLANRLRKFVTHPLCDRLAFKAPLWRRCAKHVVNAGCLMTVVQPLECVVVVTEPPVNRPVAKLIHDLAQLALAAPSTGVVCHALALAFVTWDENTHKCLLCETCLLYEPVKLVVWSPNFLNTD